jgi:hypothetical protein
VPRCADLVPVTRDPCKCVPPPPPGRVLAVSPFSALASHIPAGVPPGVRFLAPLPIVRPLAPQEPPAIGFSPILTGASPRRGTDAPVSFPTQHAAMPPRSAGNPRGPGVARALHQGEGQPLSAGHGWKRIYAGRNC